MPTRCRHTEARMIDQRFQVFWCPKCGAIKTAGLRNGRVWSHPESTKLDEPIVGDMADFERLHLASTDDEAAVIEAVAIKAGILAKCPHEECQGWVTRLPAAKYDCCGRKL